MNKWILEGKGFNEKEQLHTAPVNTLGNGLMGCRGFFEEQQQGIAALGGIYMAGVLGKAEYQPWSGVGRELVNIPNFLWMRIAVDGCELCLTQEAVRELCTRLDLQNSTLTRSYTYYCDGQPQLSLSFFRYLSYHDIFTAGQSLVVTPLAEGLTVTVECGINTNITNLNLVSCEPHPVQPGRRQYSDVTHTADVAVVKIPEPEETLIAFAQRSECDCAPTERTATTHLYTIRNRAGQPATVRRQVSIALSIEDGGEVEQVVRQRLTALPGWEQQLSEHQATMDARWNDMDIQLDGSDDDQLALRYNLYQLMAACPEHNDRYSIGARGLTGEMYEGCAFWDTEIFMVPFFTMTRPDAAKKLLTYRYHTLPQARRHAQSNWLAGAMYGWQVNYRGEEQTPQGVGAYYSIHVIADIAFALLDYWYSTGDADFMLEQGLEIAIETARFWVSRVQQRPDGQYDIMAVRGPNEYDVIVNNNLYTNMMARENMVLCRGLLGQFAASHPDRLAELKAKLDFDDSEPAVWQDIEDNIILPYDKENDLWLEDDCWLRRRPLDMQRAKPTAKRIIDTTIPYEALPLYQVSKQADVLHVMKNLPWYFTETQMQTAYDHYLPRTAFDSSLSYSMFALMSARLGRMETAASFFERTVNLDIKNVQLNTISGMHFASFGGTWQTVVFGFGGISIQPDRLLMKPHLPEGWRSLGFKLFYRGVQLEFVIERDRVTVNRLTDGAAVKLSIYGATVMLDNDNRTVIMEVK